MASPLWFRQTLAMHLLACPHARHHWPPMIAAFSHPRVHRKPRGFHAAVAHTSQAQHARGRRWVKAAAPAHVTTRCPGTSPPEPPRPRFPYRGVATGLCSNETSRRQATQPLPPHPSKPPFAQRQGLSSLAWQPGLCATSFLRLVARGRGPREPASRGPCGRHQRAHDPRHAHAVATTWVTNLCTDAQHKPKIGAGFATS